MSNAYILHFLAVVLAGWVNRQQQAVIDYLIEENRVFKQPVQGRRLQLSDNDRRRLAAKAKALIDGRKYVSIKDVEQMAYPVLRHRIITSYEAEAENITSDHIVQRILDHTQVP